MSSTTCLQSEGVWLDGLSFSVSEELFYCNKSGTTPKRPKSPGPVHFDKSANRGYHKQQNRNNNSNSPRNNSKSPHNNNRQQYHGGNGNGNGSGGGGPGYYRNTQYYNQPNQQQFGELKQHIAQARQTIQRALRHSGKKNSGNGNSGGWNRNSGSNGGKRNNSGGDWWRNGRNSQSDNGSASRRKRTVSFEDSSGELTLKVEQLEAENEALQKLTKSLETQLEQLMARVGTLEAAK